MAAMLAASAWAADNMPPEITLKEVSVKEARGWYVRGDVGYAVHNRDSGASFQSYDASSGDYRTGTFDSTRFDGTFSGDIGVGYQFNDLLRADLTGDFFRGDFDGRFDSAAPCAGGAAGTGCSARGSSSFTGAGLMLNGYVDLGTLAGFTPYVGAGVGATHLRWGDFTASSSCVGGVSGCGGAAPSSTRYGGESDWRATYALMAGVAYDVSANVKIDLGYRYSHVAGGGMFGFSDADSVAGANGTMGRSGSLDRHEIRIGLRVLAW